MYVTRIKELLSSIRAALQYVLPLNRKAADQYLKTTWVRTLKLTQKVSTHSDWAMADNFRDYYEYEEQRLRSNLERIKYHIDASDTVSLVLGSDRLEAVCSTTSLLTSSRVLSNDRLCCPFSGFFSRTTIESSELPDM